VRLGILTSHRGTNLQAIIDACETGLVNGNVELVISNNSQSLALSRAAAAGIATQHLSGKTHADPGSLDSAIKAALENARVDLVLTLGYMKKLGPLTLARYHNQILNIHPSLLPDFGGQGMYGSKVHEAVLAAGKQVTGATIHYVSGEYDTGPVITQKTVRVLKDDDAESLATRVLHAEHELLIETLAEISHGKLKLDIHQGHKP